MSRYAKNTLIFCSLLFFFSCGRNYNATRSVNAKSEVSGLRSDYETNNSNEQSIFAQDPAIKRFFVPPEIAYIQASVYATGSSYAETAQFAEDNSQKIVDSLNKVSSCSAKLLEYNHPVKGSSSKIISGEETYSSNTVLQIIVDFTGTKDIQGRITRVNNCLTSIPKIKLQNPQKKNSSISLRLSRTVPTVRNMGAFRQQLLERKFANLRDVAQTANLPPQFKPDATTCTSNGQVKIHERSLGRIELDIDFKCKQFK